MPHDVARVQFGVGGLIIHPEDKSRLLLLRRSSSHSDFNKEKWELLYGRKASMENVEAALLREAHEELGLHDLRILYPIRLWHFYRGEPSPESEILGITFVCTTQQTSFQISDEHTDYAWVTPDEALKRVTVSGILQDIRLYAEGFQGQVPLTTLEGNLREYNIS